MKKTFLLLFVLLAITSYSQTNTLEEGDFVPKIKKQISEKNTKDPTGIPIGNAANAYSTYLERNQISYDPDLNTITFVHRCSEVGSYSSGELAFDFSTDGGETWTSNVWISPDMQNQPVAGGCRYPTAAIYNPSGNTNPALAHIVSAGPSLCDATGSWGYTYEINANIEQSPSNIHDWYGSFIGDNTDYHPRGIQRTPDGTMWYIVGNNDPNNGTNTFYIRKGTFNTSTNSMDWITNKVISPDLYFIDNLIQGWNIAFHPGNPNIGYAVILCIENGDSKMVPTPKIWKTLDGGDNWEALTDINLADFETQLEDYIYHESGSAQLPYFNSLSTAVDANGKLHMFVELASGTPQLGEFYSAIGTKHYFDVTTTDGTDWEMLHVSPLKSSEAVWGDIEVNMHPKVLRTQTGDRLFYIWSDSPESYNAVNDLPDIFVKGWAPNNDTTELVNLTSGTVAQNFCFYPQFSPIVIDHRETSNEIDFEFPTVIALIDYSNGMPTDPSIYAYLKGFGMDDWNSFSIISNPENGYVCESGSVEFTVGANGVTDYQWQESTNGVDFLDVSDGGVYSGANTPILQISEAQGMEGYLYRCEVSNDTASLISGAASINIDTMVVALAGGDQLICGENTTTLEANNPAPGIGEWSIVSGYADIEDISLYNSTVDNLENGLNVFQWEITNGACVATDEVDVVVIITSAGANMSTCDESINMYGMQPEYGTGTWTVVEGGGDIQDVNEYNTEISNIPEGNNIYQWEVNYETCSVSDQVEVYRYLTPEITAQPNNVVVEGGGIAVFTVLAEGDIAGYHWRKDGVNLNNGGNITGAQSITLTITNVSEADKGNYTCLVDGVCVDIESDIASLGIEGVDNIAKGQIKLYPNPSNGNLTLEVNNSGNMIIKDLTGRVVYKTTINKGKNQCNLNQLTKGIYFVEVSQGDKVYSAKLIFN